MRRVISVGPALLVLATASSLLWFTPAVLRRLSASQTEAQIQLARRTIESDDILERLNRAIRAVADSVEPSVVHIDVFAPEAARSIAGSTGSGWLFDTRGHVITNAHVVRQARSIRVQLHDGRVQAANLVGIDPFTDIAVLKIDASDLVPIRRATGDRVHQGERVFAFGSPFGFKFSMSEGIVSGLGRAAGPALDSGGFTNFIQTDAAVNPGNSGGPLVDIQGRVVGMNVAIATAKDSQGGTEGQSSGISFAIPLTTIESVVTQLIETGKVRRGFLGVSFGGFRRFFDENSNLPGVDLQVTSEGPAFSAGLRTGDRVLAINGSDVTSVEVLRSLISNTRPGEVARLRVRRGEETRDFDVTMGEMATGIILRSRVIEDIEEDLGLTLEDDQDVSRVRQVVPGGRGARAGLRDGDTVLAVNGEPVTGFIEFLAALVDSGFYAARPVKLSVRGDDQSRDDPPREVTIEFMSRIR
ncbi:MAG TPA: trypsin-like peptidase domain-containing protein [Phycisphaerales bacterium]